MYVPNPIDISKISLNNDIVPLKEILAKSTHEVQVASRIAEGWIYGNMRNDMKKQHPCLVPYEVLPESEKEYDCATAMETLKVIHKLGFVVIKTDIQKPTGNQNILRVKGRNETSKIMTVT